MTPQSVYPTVRYRDARAGIDWLTNVLGMQEHEVFLGLGDVIVHAQLAFESNLIMIGTAGEDDAGLVGKSWIYLSSVEVDRLHQHAADSGADVVQPLAEQDYGSHEYTVSDPEGNRWSVGTYSPQMTV